MDLMLVASVMMHESNQDMCVVLKQCKEEPKEDELIITIVQEVIEEEQNAKSEEMATAELMEEVEQVVSQLESQGYEVVSIEVEMESVTTTTKTRVADGSSWLSVLMDRRVLIVLVIGQGMMALYALMRLASRTEKVEEEEEEEVRPLFHYADSKSRQLKKSRVSELYAAFDM